MSFQVFLSIGTNIGDKRQNIFNAYLEIEKQIGQIVKKSSIFKTPPWGNINQDDFYNSVIKVDSKFYPLDLLSQIKKIEIGLGRVSSEKWGPRLIDIDILYFENYHFKTDFLEIPHKFIIERKFVLQPLAEIEPDFCHTNSQSSISKLLINCVDQQNLIKV